MKAINAYNLALEKHVFFSLFAKTDLCLTLPPLYGLRLVQGVRFKLAMLQRHGFGLKHLFK